MASIHVRVVSREREKERVREEQVCIKGRKKKAHRRIRPTPKLHRHWQNVIKIAFKLKDHPLLKIKTDPL